MRKIFVTLICMILFTVPVHAEFIVEDNAELLSSQSINQLQDLAEETFKQELNDIDVVVYTSNDYVSSREAASSSAYEELATHPDGVIIYVNMNIREIDVSGRGHYESILPDKACQQVYDDVVEYFTDADYTTGFEEFISNSYKYSHDPVVRQKFKVSDVISRIGFPLVIGIVVLIINMTR